MNILGLFLACVFVVSLIGVAVGTTLKIIDFLIKLVTLFWHLFVLLWKIMWFIIAIPIHLLVICFKK